MRPGKKRKRVSLKKEVISVSKKVKLSPDLSKDNNKKIHEVEEDIDAVDNEVTLKEPEVRRSPNGYILPPPLPPGLIVRDNRGHSWIVRRSIGVGGFGEIYSASSSKEGTKAENYVIKVEPHTNGPLFVEINFYIRCARSIDLRHFRETNYMKHLGIPDFVASGSFNYMKNKLRFLVLPRFANDFEKMTTFCGGYFDESTACNAAVQVLDCLEYIHSCGFVHKDIKSSNLLLDRTDGNRVYLADYGLASKYIHHGIHKPYVEDVRWAHEGTLEYTSRDGHLGCPSRRGDIEVLLYNIVEWLGGRLPWDHTNLQKPSFYKEAKFTAFQDPIKFLDTSFGADGYPDFLLAFMKSIQRLEFMERPNYELFRQLLKKKSFPKLTFTKMPERSLVTFRRCSSSNQENIEPKSNNKIITKSKRNNSSNEMKTDNSVFVVPETDLEFEAKRQQRIKLLIKESWKNPTPVMIEILEQIKARKGNSKPFLKFGKRSTDVIPTSLTPAMEAVIRLREEKKSKKSTTSLRKFEGKNYHHPSHHRELSNLQESFSNPKITRSHSVPNTMSMTSRSLRKQVRDAVGLGLGNIGEFLKSFYPFRSGKK